MKNRSSVSEKQVSFTLVELLVVIAVIAILASLLMPTLQKAKEKSRRILCMGNLRQVGLASASYANDNEGMFPPGNLYNFPYAGDNSMNFVGICLSPYLANTRELFHCPASANYDSWSKTVATTGDFIGAGANRSILYIYLGNYALNLPQPGYARQITDPTRRKLLQDIISTHWVGINHQEVRGGNVLWTDGSVAWQGQGEMRAYSRVGSDWWW